VPQPIALTALAQTALCGYTPPPQQYRALTNWRLDGSCGAACSLGWVPLTSLRVLRLTIMADIRSATDCGQPASCG
jgi:hypothetical protein